MSKYDDKIKELEEQIDKLQKEKLEYEVLNAYQRLAIDIHELFCHSDHAEQCGWFYEIKDGVHEWDRSTHKRHLEKAKKLLNEGYSLNDLIKLNEIGFTVSV